MAARQRVRINSPVGSSKQRSGAVASAPEHHPEVAEAAAAAVFGQRASTPSTADVLTAQRFAGNQVMTRLLHTRDLIAPGPPMARVQRNEESQKLLAKLAKPQVLPGPEVQVQDDIVTGLEAKISEAVTGGKEKESHYIVSCLGGILLGTTPGDLDTLIKQSKLYDLPEGERSIGPSTFDLAVEAGVTEKIVINTLATMEAAGQLDYLRKSGLIDTDWKVIVEVHYYRDRNPEQTKFHKDSTGQTLFVNLNFTNEQEIAGPEVVVNPATSPDYEKKLEKGSYQNAKTLKRFKLPKVFVEDLQQTKQELGEPEEIIQTVVKPKHFVAFVDEAVHHKTPTLGHRTVTTLEIDSYMRKKYKHDYEDAARRTRHLPIADTQPRRGATNTRRISRKRIMNSTPTSGGRSLLTKHSIRTINTTVLSFRRCSTGRKTSIRND